ncbi:MAG: hypothetical protein IT226_05415 [Flavobacteriales bacterium]|nr:hypothetical protein [Flavobacteriales bacterium]
MNIRILLTAGCIAMTGLLVAQESTAPVQSKEQAPALQISRLTSEGMIKELGLTPEQVSALEKIEQEHSEAMKDLNRENLEPAAKRTRTIEARDKKQAAIKAVLTKDQAAKWEELKKNQRAAYLKQRQEHTAAPTHQE